MVIFFIIKVLLIASLIRLLESTRKPLLCASIYVGFRLGLSILFGHTISYLLVGSFIAGLLAALYFWLLDYFAGTGPIYWGIAIGGIFIGLV